MVRLPICDRPRRRQLSICRQRFRVLSSMSALGNVACPTEFPKNPRKSGNSRGAIHPKN